MYERRECGVEKTGTPASRDRDQISMNSMRSGRHMSDLERKISLVNRSFLSVQFGALMRVIVVEKGH